MPTADKRFYRRFRTLVAHAQRNPQIVKNYTPQRTLQPGPAALQRMTLGFLATEAARAWLSDSPLMKAFVADELARRGLEESAALVGNPSHPSEDSVDLAAENLQIDYALQRLSTTQSFDQALISLGTALDLVEPEAHLNQGHTMLSTREQLDDLIAVSAPPEMIAAYVSAVEITDTHDTLITEPLASRGYDSSVALTRTHDVETSHEL